MIQKLIYRIKILRKVSLYANGVKKIFFNKINMLFCFVNYIIGITYFL